MHSSNSFLYTVIERIRAYLDDPDSDAKYTNDFIIRHVLAPSMVDVLARLNMDQSNPLIIRHALEVEAGVEYYHLPPCIQQVWRITRMDEDETTILADAYPRGEFHPAGPGWSLEANTLRINPLPTADETLYLSYTPSGDFLPHYGSGTLADVSGEDIVTLAATPTLGALDRRENAYAGGILRILPASGPVEERVVVASYYDAGAWKARVRRPFDETADGAVTYEIAPAGSQPLYSAIALAGALNLGTMRGISERRETQLLRQYRTALKTIGDNLSNINARVGKHFQRNTIDNPGWGISRLF